MLSRLQRIPALLGKVPGGLEVAGAEREVEGGGHHQPPQATPPFPSGHQSILGADMWLCPLRLAPLRRSHQCQYGGQ